MQGNYPKAAATQGYAINAGIGASSPRDAIPAIQGSGQISAQLSGLENDLDNIDSIATALGRRLFPITGLDLDSPVPAGCSQESMPQSSQVPIADRVMYLRERLNNTSHILDLVLNRIEI